MNKFFAGIGSRETPKTVISEMSQLSEVLTRRGYILRSGGAPGADQAFQRGVVGNNAQIWLPWKGFEKDFSEDYPDHEYMIFEEDKEAIESVKRFHPNYKNMERGPEKKFKSFMLFMSRNYRQIIGKDEPNSEFVICWTDGGGEKGGTGQALRIAKHFKIPIFNFYNMRMVEILNEIQKLDLLY